MLKWVWVNIGSGNGLLPVASFTKEVDWRLAKRPLKTNGCLANHQLASLVKEASDGPPGVVFTNFITMTSQWARWRLKSPASPLFTRPFIRAPIKENIKAPRHWPLRGEFTGDLHKWPVTEIFPFDDVIMFVQIIPGVN